MTHFELVKELLGERGVDFNIFEHKKFESSKEAMSLVEGVNDRNALKSILFKADGEFFLCIVPLFMKIDKEKVKAHFEIIGTLKLATPEETYNVTKCVVGTVSPFAQFYDDVSVVFEPSILSLDRVFMTPGSYNHTVSLRGDDLIDVVDPVMADVVER